MNTITATQVAEADRLGFLPRHLGAVCVEVEALIFSIMDRASEDYSGGFWTFYDLSNGGFFVAPDREDRMRVAWEDNFFSGEMSPEAAGIGATLMALGWVSFKHDIAARKFHDLSDFARAHPEAGAIFGFID